MIDTLRRVTTNLIKQRVRLLYDSDYRHRRHERRRLDSLQRYQSGSTTLLGPSTRFADSASFLSAYNYIFDDEIYDFDVSKSDPVILDGGANVGLAIFYWKQRYPDAQITAFEPDPEIFDILRWNCQSHGYSDVELIQKGLWKRETEMHFASDSADAGHFTEVGQFEDKKDEPISTIRLRPFLNEPIDLLKLDIEGSEVEVILDCEGALNNVKRLFVEYHSFVDQDQRLDSILRVLHDAGFRYHIQPELVSKQPFLKRRHSYGMDQRLNIFAYRSRCA